MQRVQSSDVPVVATSEEVVRYFKGAQKARHFATSSPSVFTKPFFYGYNISSLEDLTEKARSTFFPTDSDNELCSVFSSDEEEEEERQEGKEREKGKDENSYLSLKCEKSEDSVYQEYDLYHKRQPFCSHDENN